MRTAIFPPVGILPPPCADDGQEQVVKRKQTNKSILKSSCNNDPAQHQLIKMADMKYSPLRTFFRLSTCLLLLCHGHGRRGGATTSCASCAAFSARGSSRRTSRSRPGRGGHDGARPTGTTRPAIPTNSFAHLSALRDGIDILQAPDGKGMGAFASVDICKGTTLGEYTGEVLTRREVEARYWGLRRETRHDRKWRNSRRRRNQGLSGDYLFDIGSDLFIDGEDADVSSWCRFANHAHPHDRTSACNVEARTRPKAGALEDTETCGIFFVALHDIAAGTEISYDYSDEYWDNAE